MGPSPLARGSRNARRRARHRPRSIPARAGQPGHLCGGGANHRVHPRSRGAARITASTMSPPLGPSPLARGSPACGPCADRRQGSIPARAGQPSRRTWRALPLRVHPRSRGAANAESSASREAKGPSPLARGSRSSASLGTGWRGSIPARAGQPPGAPRTRSTRRVHPRSRGAARSGALARIVDQGPSPLARGSRQSARQRFSPRGSIPARAGQPTPHLPKPDAEGVHPRSRGAAAYDRGQSIGEGGPSPLARGSQDELTAAAADKGSIPARAGQPLKSDRGSTTGRVHPRSRGAATLCSGCASPTRGPSPLARGSPPTTLPRSVSGRSIPARAGQPAG